MNRRLLAVFVAEALAAGTDTQPEDHAVEAYAVAAAIQTKENRSMTENTTITPPVPEPDSYDFGELLLFAHKAESEGFDYARDEYAPEFEAPALAALVEDRDAFEAWWEDAAEVVEQWRKRVGWEAAAAAYDAHLAASEARSAERRASQKDAGR